jgi:hypothetical protein
MSQKDLIPEKIIDDLEVGCINKACEWKDKLELLEKHVKNCKVDKELPSWIREQKEFINVDEDNLHMDGDDHLVERLNEEVPKLGFAARLYKKGDANSREFLTSLYSTKTVTPRKIAKSKAKQAKMDMIEDWIEDMEDDEETNEIPRNQQNKEIIVLDPDTDSRSRSCVVIDKPEENEVDQVKENATQLLTVHLGTFKLRNNATASTGDNSSAKTSPNTVLAHITAVDEIKSQNDSESGDLLDDMIDSIMNEPTSVNNSKKRKSRSGKSGPTTHPVLKKLKSTAV